MVNQIFIKCTNLQHQVKQTDCSATACSLCFLDYPLEHCFLWFSCCFVLMRKDNIRPRLWRNHNLQYLCLQMSKCRTTQRMYTKCDQSNECYGRTGQHSNGWQQNKRRLWLKHLTSNMAFVGVPSFTACLSCWPTCQKSWTAVPRSHQCCVSAHPCRAPSASQRPEHPALEQNTVASISLWPAALPISSKPLGSSWPVLHCTESVCISPCLSVPFSAI